MFHGPGLRERQWYVEPFVSVIDLDKSNVVKSDWAIEKLLH